MDNSQNLQRRHDHSICFDMSLIERYGGRGPRYTSYPTALQFNSNFKPLDYKRHARGSNVSGRPLSIYVHIPFCKSLCYYCACNKIVTRNAARVSKYMQRLAREIDLQSMLFDRRRPVKQLHFGGGTPTYLDEIQLRLLMAHLRRAFAFNDKSNREFSIEVDPRTINAESLAVLAELGFNRLSLGVQDFDPQVQHAVNRHQSATDVAALCISARNLAYRSVSFDLIYGLPHQTVASFDRTLDQVIEMRPDRLAVYNYAHLPSRFKGQRMIAASDIPAPRVKLDILHHTIDKLAHSDYVYVGMDHFALPGDDLVLARKKGTLQRNFQGYSTHGDCDLVGLGVSAISSIGNAYSQNAASTRDYESMLSLNKLPVWRGIELDRDDQIRAAAIQQLMCYDVLDFRKFGTAHDIDFAAYFCTELQTLEDLASDGLLVLEQNRIRVSPKGRLLLRSIAMVFDRYVSAAASDDRFSKAI